MYLRSVSIPVLLVSQICAAQSNGSLLSRFSFGATAGIQLMEPSPQSINATDFPTVGTKLMSIVSFDSRRYTVGPILEFAITRNIAVEFNPLYKRVGSSQDITFFSAMMPVGDFSVTRTRANAWEFPIVGKYYFGRSDRTWRAFAGAGLSWEKSWQHSDISSVFLDPATGNPVGIPALSFTSDVTTPARLGRALEGGVLLHKGGVGFAPEFRYTRWGYTRTNPDLRDRDQLEILVSVRF